MIAIDILEVPISRNNNRYLLVIQDYFTKWAEAISLVDQKAERITQELVKVCATMGLPEIVHSDQGRNFESTIFGQTLEEFGIVKTRTTSYHPQGDGMVERFNRTLLQLFRTYVDKQDDWEKYLPLLLFAYRTAVHKSTGVSPFRLMFGRHHTHVSDLSLSKTYDPKSYEVHLRLKLAELHDFVDTHMSQAANQQKQYYDQHSKRPSFAVGDLIWLQVPTTSKFQCKWDGDWKVKAIKSPITVEITKDKKSRVVHVNRIRHRIQRSQQEMLDRNSQSRADWQPPDIEHMVIPPVIPPLLPLPQDAPALCLPSSQSMNHSQCVDIHNVTIDLQIDIHMELEDELFEGGTNVGLLSN
jgi:hypothetical protein